ncbi:unnamed protein product [Caenorhabditis angaria]|uniref:Uncharacterized protein n=1 Tax=Caenorhabditis angaria TaxID=860376 RepID=A0A9P1N0E0_9PELO|nr:unnamed protein product [Caenorhabditis angaria]
MCSNAPTTSSAGSKNSETYSREEIAYLESMVRVMKWAEQRSLEIRNQLVGTNESGPVISDTQQQANDILTQFFTADANGNNFPLNDFMHVFQSSPFQFS